MELSLDQVVLMCKRAQQECSKRAERYLTEVNPSPAVAKSVTEQNHKRRRDDAYDKCMDAASSVLAQCPEPERIRDLVNETQRDAKKQLSSSSEAPDGGSKVVFHEPHFQLRRCETVVASFVNVLFAMANAPTRYELETKDFHEQRKQEKIGAYAEGTKKTVTSNSALGKRQLAPGMTGPLGGGGDNNENIADIVSKNFGGGLSAQQAGGAWMDQKDSDGIPIRPGTGHLTKEQRMQLEELAQGSDPKNVKVWK